MERKNKEQLQLYRRFSTLWSISGLPPGDRPMEACLEIPALIHCPIPRGLFNGNVSRKAASANQRHPMIDLLLVLIIAFMVVTRLTPSGRETLVPQPELPIGSHSPYPTTLRFRFRTTRSCD